MNTFRVFRVFFFRELHAAVLSRLVYVFCGMALLAGWVPLLGEAGPDRTEIVVYALLQASLFLIPLFAILTGVGSAQNEQEEEPLLMSQPIGRGVRVLGKFAALWGLIAVAAGLLVFPAILSGCRIGALGFLWFHTFAVGGVFAALGLAVGFSSSDRVKAHMIGLCAWLVLLAGFNLLALAAAHVAEVQRWPQLWLGLLMVNPLDALRISAMFTLDRIPFDVASAPPLGQWWLGHLSLWFVLLCSAWIAAALAWSRARLERLEF